MSKPKPSELTPVDWERVEADYRAGLLSVREIGRRNGCSHTAIGLKAEELGWTRDLNAKIKAKADALLAKTALARPLANGNPESEKAIIDANASMLSQIAGAQRFWADKALKIVSGMLEELQTTMEAPEVYGQVHALLMTGEDPDPEKLRQLADLITSLPARERTVRGLMESLHRAIALQRTVYSMDDKQKPPEDVDSFESLRDLAAAALEKGGTT